MLKYQNLLIILSVIIISISTFYIQSALANKELPRYSIRTIEGNEKEIANIQLEGSDQLTRNNDWITITPTKTKYRSEESFLENIGMNYSNKMKELQKEYRSFMRGKSDWDTFFEDEDTLAHAKVKERGSENERSFTLKISILDKKKKEDTSYKIELPNKNNYYSIYVKDVQMTEDELKVISENYRINSRHDVHVYSIDLQSKKLVGDEVISDKNENEGFLYNRSFSTSFVQSKYLIFQSVETKEVQSEDGNIYSEENIKKLSVYDLEKNQKTILHLPNKLKKIKLDLFSLYNDDKNIYFINHSEKELLAIVYNFHSQKISNTYKFPFDKNSYENSYVINKDRLYIVVNPNMEVGQKKHSPIQLYAVNLLDGKVVYKGEVKASKDSKAHLRIHSIRFN